MEEKHKVRFRRISFITIVAVYLLILAGGIVRSTGSGMGCPDWPKCFGRYIPPTDISELPADYKERYKVHGFEAEFNATKTWIEYINRLLGALVGLLSILVVIYALPYLKSDKIIFYLSILAVLLVGFEGWLGSVVVSSNLAPLMVTLHMAGSLVIVAVLVYIITRSYSSFKFESFYLSWKKILPALGILMFLTFVQILLGTQVREAVDIVAAKFEYLKRELWIENLGINFQVHRFLGYLTFFAAVYFFVLIKKNVSEIGIMYKCSLYILFLMAVEVVLGVALAKFSLPQYIQPLHLLFATIVLGIEFFILSLVFEKEIRLA